MNLNWWRGLLRRCLKTIQKPSQRLHSPYGLQHYISDAIDAAEHGATDFAQRAVTSMNHSQFGLEEIVFDLQGNYWGPVVREILEEIIGRMGQPFQDRVRFIE